MKKNETDAVEKLENGRPLLTDGIGHRINGLFEKHGSKKKISDKTGISLSQLGRYIEEESQPTVEPLARLAAEAGVCLEWLATGKGPKFVRDKEVQRFDVETLQKAIETLEKGLEMTGRVVTNAADKAHLVAMVYDYLTDDSQDAAGRSDSVVRLLQIVR